MTEHDTMTFAEKLRRFRRLAGLTQEALAEQAGLTAKGLAAIERGRRRHPYPHTVQALADALGLSTAERAEFIGSIPDRAPPSGTESSRTRLPPIPPTPLIGRNQEVAEVTALLQTGPVRLVTLTGPAGVGKTRLALDVAHNLLGGFPDGAAFVSLAGVSEPAIVLPTIAHALGLQSGSDDSLQQSIGDRSLLLVLDNVEQVVDVAPDIATLLAACPGLALLVTSRTSLRIRAERAYSLQPLPLPDLSRILTPEEVSQSSAVQLFLDRATASAPSFTLTQANCNAIAAICRRLDGLPLALELAAAHIRILDPTSLLARLDNSLTLLADGSRDLPSRQQTLRAAIAWSYDLLDPDEQMLFRRLSVFSGGWTLESAEQTCRDEGESIDVLACMTRLIDHHLVTVSEQLDSSTIRFNMLQTIREFALERLRACGEDEQTHRCHAAFFAGMAENLRPEIWSHDIVERVAILDTEQENLRAAIRWSFDHDEQETAVRLAASLQVFWWTANFFHEGRAWLHQAMTRRHEVSRDTRARALLSAAVLAYRVFDSANATVWLEEALPIFREAEDEQNLAMAIYYQASLKSLANDVTGAINLFEESERRFERAGNQVMALAAANHLGDLWQRQGKLEHARTIQSQVLASARALEHAPLRATVLHTQGRLAFERGEHALAARFFLEHLDIEWIKNDGVGVSDILVAVARLLVKAGRPETAGRFIGAAEALRIDGGLGASQVRPSDVEATLALAMTAAGAKVITEARESGRLLSANSVIDEARAAMIEIVRANADESAGQKGTVAD